MMIKIVKLIGIAGIVLHSIAQPVYAAEKQRPLREERAFNPPEEMLLACKGLSENDACAFAGRNDELINGVCSLPPPHVQENTTLACKPDQMRGHPNMEPPADRED